MTMNFALMIAALIAVLAAELSPASPVDQPMAQFSVALGGVLLVIGFSMALTIGTVRRVRAPDGSLSDAIRGFARGQRFHLLIWLTAVANASVPCQWGRIMRANAGLGRIPLLDELLILAPVWLPLTVSWYFFHQVETAIAQKNASQEQRPSCPEYIRVRASYFFGLLLGPLLFVLLVRDVVQLASQGNLSIEVMIPTSGLALVAVFLLMPFWTRIALRTEPLPNGPLRRRLLSLAGAANTPVQQFRVWQTSGAVVNAAITAGLLPSRDVFLSDGLIAKLSPSEVEAIVAHELGHASQNHGILRMAAVFVPAAASIGSFTLLGLPQKTIDDPLTALIGIAIGAFTLVLLSIQSHRLEHQADLAAIRILLRSEPAEESPTRRYIRSLIKLTRLAAPAKYTGWLHPCVRRRIRVIRAAFPRFPSSGQAETCRKTGTTGTSRIPNVAFLIKTIRNL